MKTAIYDTPDLLAKAAAAEILDLVRNKPDAVLCMASGDTPRLTNQYIAEGAKKNDIDFSRVQFVSLDEWVGIARTNTGSCYHFLHETVFEPLSIKPANIHFFNAVAGDLEVECKKINGVIEQYGGIDLMLVGIGMNGHVGFNEPGVSPQLHAHVIELDPVTQQTGQKYFSGATTLPRGISLGLAQFMQSRLAILMASGHKKALIVKKALEEMVSSSVPASFIQEHQHALVLLDKEAAGLLS